MPRSPGGAALIMAAVPLAEASPGESLFEKAEATISAYVEAGIRAFLLPGFLLGDTDSLSAIVASARRLTDAHELGRALVAIGGGSAPGFGAPPFPAGLRPLGIAALAGKVSAAKAAAHHSGRLLGDILGACALDLVLAPSLDLASDPKNLDGVLDGFGDDPFLAGALGAAFVKGLASAGVAACAGRFPGLGSICAEGPGRAFFVPLPIDRLEACEIKTFSRVTRAGIPAMLVGRALVPALEPERIPAARSARIVEGRLREALGFKGLVIGDALDAESDPGRAAVLGILAGCDLNLALRPENALAAASCLDKAISDGELPIPRMKVARDRTDRFLARRPRPLPEPDMARTLPNAGSLRRVERDRERSVTLLKPFAAPFAPGGGKGLLLVFLPPPGSLDDSETAGVLETLRAELPDVDLLTMPCDPSPSEAEALIASLAPPPAGKAAKAKGKADAAAGNRPRYEVAAILSYDAHFRPAQEGLARFVEESVPRCVIIAMRDPYDAAFFPRADGLAAVYGFSAGGARCAGKLLKGLLEARGSSPVRVIGLEV